MGLFEDVQKQMNYASISDLRNMSSNVANHLDAVLLRIDPADYDREQWQDFSRYLFPNLKVPLPSDSKEMRRNLIMAAVDYRRLMDQISGSLH